jgi:hypothetical protein
LQYKIFVASLVNKSTSELNEVKKLFLKNLWFLQNDGKMLGN